MSDADRLARIQRALEDGLGITESNLRFLLELVYELQHDLADAKRQRELVAAVARAIRDEGPQPEHHRATMVRHRAEWPALWAALDALTRDASPPPLSPNWRQHQ
jgi:hypothetical protein